MTCPLQPSFPKIAERVSSAFTLPSVVLKESTGMPYSYTTSVICSEVKSELSDVGVLLQAVREKNIVQIINCLYVVFIAMTEIVFYLFEECLQLFERCFEDEQMPFNTTTSKAGISNVMEASMSMSAFVIPAYCVCPSNASERRMLPFI